TLRIQETFNRHRTPTPDMIATVVTGVVIGLAAFITWMILWVKGVFGRCPRCRKRHARQYDGETLVAEERCYGLVTRHASTHSSGSTFGAATAYGQPAPTNYHGTTYSSSSTSWQERVPVIRTTYRLRYHCRFCSNRWSKLETDQVEDFSRR